LAPINLEMEWFHLFNKLEQLCHIDQRPSNQSISIPHLKVVEPRTTPTIVWQGVTYPQGTWPVRLVPALGERSQVLHHKSISRGNQSVGIVTYTYCQ
jgi:hypothetical protein